MNTFIKKQRIKGIVLLFMVTFVVFAFTLNNKNKENKTCRPSGTGSESDMCIVCHEKSGKG